MLGKDYGSAQGPLWDTADPLPLLRTPAMGKGPHRDPLSPFSNLCSGAHTVVPNMAGWRWSLSPFASVLLARGGLGPPVRGWPGSLAGRGPRRSASARVARSPARGGRRRQMSCSSSARGCSCPMSLSLWCTADCRLWTVASEVSSCSWRAAISLAGRQDMAVTVLGHQRSSCACSCPPRLPRRRGGGRAPRHCLRTSSSYGLNVVAPQIRMWDTYVPV